ncbi:MAG: DUF1906 domain-containing protein [Massilia sp.]
MKVLHGLDTRSKLDLYAGRLAACGFDFAVRYYGRNPARNLTRPEALALADAGLELGAIWEAEGYRGEYFSYEQGLADGLAAQRMARDEIGQPAGSAIYFAVDFDPSGSELVGPVTHYFKGIRTAFEAAPADQRYLVGIYGSGTCCRAMLYARLARFGWLSQSRGYAGYLDYSEYNLKQLAADTLRGDGLAPLHFDRNQSNPLQQTGLFTIRATAEV